MGGILNTHSSSWIRDFQPELQVNVPDLVSYARLPNTTYPLVRFPRLHTYPQAPASSGVLARHSSEAPAVEPGATFRQVCLNKAIIFSGRYSWPRKLPSHTTLAFHGGSPSWDLPLRAPFLTSVYCALSCVERPVGSWLAVVSHAHLCSCLASFFVKTFSRCRAVLTPKGDTERTYRHIRKLRSEVGGSLTLTLREQRARST